MASDGVEMDVEVNMNFITKDYGLVILAVVSGCILNWVLQLRVGYMRFKHKVNPPATMDETIPEFNTTQRVYMNSVEAMPIFVSLTSLSGIAYPIPAAVLAFIWVIFRIVYVLGYTFNPNYRVPGFLGSLAMLWALGILAIITAAKLLGA